VVPNRFVSLRTSITGSSVPRGEAGASLEPVDVPYPASTTPGGM